LLTCAREYPSFEDNRVELIDAAKATTCLFIQERSTDGTLKKKNGTAFFVTKDHLLTAAHNVIPEDKDTEIVEIRSSYAGCRMVHNQTNTFVCEVLETLCKGHPIICSQDIAILKAPGHEAEKYVLVSNQISDLNPNTIVDVVGYPVEMSQEQKESFESSLKKPEKSFKDAQRLLPSYTLVASRGSVEGTQEGLIRYKLSTVAGMSGGLVMHDGKVYGLPLSSNKLIIGVHIGQLDDINTAVSFSVPEVSRLLKRHIVNTQTVAEGYVKVDGAWDMS
jgi:Trypsin-like peptidase domain